jgi:hypothetical protein
MSSEFGHFWVGFIKLLNVDHFFDVCPIRSRAKDSSEDATAGFISTRKQCAYGLSFPGHSNNFSGDN